MKIKIGIALIIIAVSLGGFYLYSKESAPKQEEVVTKENKGIKVEDVIADPQPNHNVSDNKAASENSSEATTESETVKHTDENIVELINALEENGALNSNEIYKLMSDSKGFDMALHRLEESYYEPEYSYETKIKYQHYFNTSPFHIEGKAQLNNLQCSPKMCLAKVAGVQSEQLMNYSQSIQSSEELPIKAMAVGYSDTHMLLAFSTDPETNAIIFRKESDE
ncbi:hypothetical protein [Kangiella sp. M94]